MAQRLAVPVPPERPRLRRVLRLHLRPLGRVLRPAARPQRQGRHGQGLHHRRPDRPRDRVPRDERGRGQAVLLLPRAQHAALADAGAGPVLAAVREGDAEAAPATRRKTSTTRGPRWRCARTSTATSAGCSRRSTSRSSTQDTIVVYFSDNGPNGSRWNGGMKGRKGRTDEGGVRSPLLVRWPAKVKPGTVVTPDRRGHRPVADAHRPGRRQARRRQAARRHQPRPAAARQGRRSRPTACSSSTGPAGSAPATSSTASTRPGSSSTWSTDPGQTQDVAADHPEVAKRLADAVERLEARRAGRAAEDATTRPFPVGYARVPADRAAGPRRRAARRREAERRGAELLVLHQLDEARRPHDLGRRGERRGPVRGDRPLHLPEGGRRLGGRAERSATRSGPAPSRRRTTRRCAARSTTASRAAASRT